MLLIGLLAAPLFTALLQEPSAEPAARVGLARIAALQGKHDVAIQHFARAIELFPEPGMPTSAMARWPRRARSSSATLCGTCSAALFIGFRRSSWIAADPTTSARVGNAETGER